MAKRACIFCGSGGVKMTAEHVWPRWVQDVLESDRAVPIRDEMTRPGKPAVVREWPAKPFRLTVKRVCRDCNGGWMADLEAETKPVLAPLMLGQPRAIGPSEQTTLARWAFKTAAMFELRYPDGRALPDRHRRELFETRRPPDGVAVWIASYRGREWDGTYRQHAIYYDFARRPRRGTPDGYIATMSLGRVIIQVFGSDWPHGTARRQIRPPLNKALQAIWPLTGRTLRWPSWESVDDEGLRYLADSLVTGLATPP